jgi:hypothetical protein
MAAKVTRLTHKIAIQLYLVAENCTICSSRSRRPVRKLLDTPSNLSNKLLINSMEQNPRFTAPELSACPTYITVLLSYDQ